MLVTFPAWSAVLSLQKMYMIYLNWCNLTRSAAEEAKFWEVPPSVYGPEPESHHLGTVLHTKSPRSLFRSFLSLSLDPTPWFIFCVWLPCGSRDQFLACVRRNKNLGLAFLLKQVIPGASLSSKITFERDLIGWPNLRYRLTSLGCFSGPVSPSKISSPVQVHNTLATVRSENRSTSACYLGQIPIVPCGMCNCVTSPRGRRI